MATPKNYLVAFLACTTIVASGVAWQLNRKLHAMELAMQTAAADRAAWQKRLSETDQRRNELETEVASLREKRPSTAAAASAPVEADPVDAPPPGRPRRDPLRNLAALMENPEFAKAWSTQQKAHLDNRYADLFRKLNLSPEQLDKFKTLLVEKQSAMMDVMSAARAEGINGREGRDQLRQLVKQAQSEVDESIKAMLGESVYAQYQTYEQTAPQRSTVSQLEQRLSYTSAPLSNAQADQLVQILAETSGQPSSSAGGPPFGPAMSNPAGGLTSISEAALARAQGVLSPSQFAALQQLQDEQLAQRKVSESFRAANRNNQDTGGASAKTSGR